MTLLLNNWNSGIPCRIFIARILSKYHCGKNQNYLHRSYYFEMNRFELVILKVVQRKNHLLDLHRHVDYDHRCYCQRIEALRQALRANDIQSVYS